MSLDTVSRYAAPEDWRAYSGTLIRRVIAFCVDYVLIAILITVMAGVRLNGGYGKITCVVLSAAALQMLSSMFNFLNISNFFRDLAWGLLLLIFLWVSEFDIRALLTPRPRTGG